MNAPILMTEEYWANTQLSIVRATGKIRLEGKEYIIVDKRGRDIFQCSIEAFRAGRDKAIEPGEPADLIQSTFVPLYRQLKRERFMKILKEHPEIKCAADMRKIIQNQNAQKNGTDRT